MHPVQQSLPAVVAELLRRQPMSPGKLLFAWQVAVGTPIARASRVSIEHDRSLVVEVDDGHWQREIERAAPTILGRLDGLLGPATFTRLDVRVAKASPSRRAVAATPDAPKADARKRPARASSKQTKSPE